MNSVLIKVLEGLTLAIPIAGAAVIRFFPFSRPLPGRFFSLLFLIPVGADLLSIGLFRVQPDPARFLAENFALVLHLAVLLSCYLIFRFEIKQTVSGGALGFLLLFFSSGFLLSQELSLALCFWLGLLATAYLIFRAFYGSRPVGNLPFTGPLLFSGILFSLDLAPAGMWVSPLAFLLFMPFFPFQRWMSFTPRSGAATVWIACRVVLFALSAWGIYRWCPLSFPATGKSLDVFLGLCALAQIQGALLAMGESVARKRVSAAIFSQMALCTPLILFALPGHPGRAAVLVVSLVLPSLALGVLADHLEHETQRQNLGDMGGLFRDMPRADILFFLFILALSAMPGSGLFSGVLGSDFSAAGDFLWVWAFASISGVVLLQWALWAAWEQIFLGPPKNTALPVSDISAGLAASLVMAFIPLIFLGIWPGILGSILLTAGGL
ncbi:MAG: hypothetical protein ACYCRD_00620 [Leptospirillum sp.]